MSPMPREWATPLTIGAFALMATTGLLMFFHVDSGLQKSAHEWLGWLMVAAVAAHAAANWGGVKRHLQRRGRGQLILGATVLALGASFFVTPQGSGGASPPVLAMQAVSRAPLSAVAPLTGKTVAQLRSDLALAGLTVGGDNQSLDTVIAGDRDKMGRAMNALFTPGAPAQ